MICLQLKNLPIKENSAIVLGKFDGMHKGHQKLMEEMRKQRLVGLKTVVFTFMPLPDIYFGLQKEGMISSYDERIRLFDEAGADYLFEFPMNEEHVRITAKDFIKEWFVDKLHVKTVIAGDDVSFGFQGKGNKQLLKELGEEYGFNVIFISKIRVNNREISSTYVREAIKNGDMSLVHTLLNRPYGFDGIVVKGHQIGRTIDTPTVNIQIDRECALPPYGVYFSIVEVQGKKYKGISNIGVKPTVGNDEAIGLETYLFDFDEDLYGQEIRVQLMYFYRPETKFESLNKLKEQLSVDKMNAEKYFEKCSILYNNDKK